MSSIKKIIPQPIKSYLIKYRYIIPEIKKRHKRELKQMIDKSTLKVDDENNWIKKFNKASFSDKSAIEIAKEFMTSEIELIKNVEIKLTDIIAICVEKNDLIKLKKFIQHHRKLGIDKFVILDNNSDDGTIEYLLKQNDVVLLQTKKSYSSSRRIAWINRIIAHYGYNRWYYVADSDELLVYEDCENKSIKNLIDYYKNHKIVRARALLLDMYAKQEYYSKGKIEKYYNECIYFDTGTYYKKENNYFYNIKGGPRKRVFEFSPCLTKYPLVYFRKKDIYIKSHYLYPYNDNYKSDCNLVLKHYKFLPTELEKIKEIAKNGNYFGGSIEYKHYIDVIGKNNKLDFFTEDTCEYKNSKSLNHISIYNRVKWK